MAAKTKSFEQNMDELETVVSELEKGESDLDEALKLFERGMKLSKQCQDQLDKAAQKVTVLTGGDDGEFGEEELDAGEGVSE